MSRLVIHFTIALCFAIVYPRETHADCSGKNYEGNKSADAKDPCGEKKIKTTSGALSGTASIVHGVAGAICLACKASSSGTEAGYGYCKKASITGGVSDVAGSVGTTAVSASVQKKIDGQGAAGAGLGAGMGGYQVASELKGKTPDTDEGKQSDCAGSAFTNALTGTAEGYSTVNSFMQANEAGKNKDTLKSDKARASVTGDSGQDKAEAAAAMGTETRGGRSKSDEHTEHTLAVSSASLDSVLKDFHDATGVHPDKIFEQIKNGEKNPFIASAKALEEKYPGITDDASRVQSIADEALANSPGLKDQILSSLDGGGIKMGTEAKFSSSNNGLRKKTPSDDGGLGDLMASLSGVLNPEKKEEKKDVGASAVGFGAKVSAAANNEGLYPASQSIFQIVTRRYQIAAKTRLDEGI